MEKIVLIKICEQFLIINNLSGSFHIEFNKNKKGFFSFDISVTCTTILFKLNINTNLC